MFTKSSRMGAHDTFATEQVSNTKISNVGVVESEATLGD